MARRRPRRLSLSAGLALKSTSSFKSGREKGDRALREAGLPESAVICDSEELPADDSELAVVATDDVVCFHDGELQARRRF